jgi:hypothetical protein
MANIPQKQKVDALRHRRNAFRPYSPEWQAIDNELFEARLELGHARAVARAAVDSTYCCESCGQEYDSLWVRYNGLRCDVECDGRLYKLEPTPRLCPECQGNGYVEGVGPGYYSESHGNWLPDERQVRCPRCGGSGKEVA